MKKNFVLAVFSSALLAAGSVVMSGSASPARRGQEEANNEAKLAKQAKITKERAQEVALTRAPGTVEGSELEREHGKLVYSFDIRNAKGTIDEVQVSAITGKVVRVEHENKQQEAAEKRKDAKEKKQ
ncbi:MAG: PepSY domain-containing protein [Pyrinomonadaceae bacterium]